MKRSIMLLSLIAALSLLTAACGDDATEDDAAETTEETSAEDGATDDEAMDETMPATVVDIAASNEDFSILVAAVTEAGLVETLSGEGPFTVFAPTNEAFAAALVALGITQEELLADTETLTGILTYHVVPGKVLSADVVGLDGQSVATVNGAEVNVSVDGETVMINDATVTAVDLEAGNGVVHVIDSVLLPPSS